MGILRRLGVIALVGALVPGVAIAAEAEEAATVAFAADNTEVAEGAGGVVLTVHRDGDTTGSASVGFSVRGGFALEGEDYIKVTGRVEFGSDDRAATFTVPIVNDARPEGVETFTVDLESPTGASLGSRSISIVTIHDDDTLSDESAVVPTTPDTVSFAQVDRSTSYAAPTGVKVMPDGRVLVTEKGGTIALISNGIRQATPFLDISDEVFDVGISQGLAGLALDPDFATNGHVYVLYTTDASGVRFGRLARYTVSATDPDVVDPQSRRVLIGETAADGFPDGGDIHHIGDLEFGRDGTLLISYGDAAGNSLTDPRLLNSQNLDNLAGAISRVDPATGDGLASNPFFTGDPTAHRSRIWAYGLRNPYRFAVGADGATDPSLGQPGTLYIGDVQRDNAEELNVARGGENFGWPYYQGTGRLLGGTPPADVVFPQRAFARGDAASIIGGDFYRGGGLPDVLDGRWLAADYRSGTVWSYAITAAGDLSGEQVFASGVFGITDMAYDPVTGNIYATLLNERAGLRGELYVFAARPAVLHGGTWVRDGFLDSMLTPSPLAQISAGSDGHVIGTTADGKALVRTAAGWRALPGTMRQVSVGSAAHVWGIATDGTLQRLNAGSWSAQPVGGVSAALRQVSVGSDGTVWAVATDRSIWNLQASGWRRSIGSLDQISVGGATHVWGVNHNNDVFQRVSSTWVHRSTVGIARPVVQVEVGADGVAYARADDNTIWQWMGAGWRQPVSTGRLTSIGIGSADHVWGVGPTGIAYEWAGRWAARTTTDARAVTAATVSVGVDGTVWAVTQRDTIYRRTSSGWQPLPGLLTRLAVVSADDVWGINRAGHLYRWDRGAWRQQSTAGIVAPLVDVAAGEDGTVVVTNASGHVHGRRADGSWGRYSGALATVSLARGNDLWGISPYGDPYRWSGLQWLVRSRSAIGQPVAHLSIGYDGAVWAVAADDTVWRRIPGSWTRQSTGARLVQVSVRSASEVWGVNRAGRLFRWVGR